MPDTKMIATVVVLLAVVFAIYYFSTKKTAEGFGFGGSMTWKNSRVISPSSQAAAKGDFYSVPGTYQSILNPRFANVDFGANLRYNMPSYENQGVPCDPLTFGNMVKNDYKENYCGGCGGGCGAVNCGKGGSTTSLHGGAPIMEGDYASGNYNQMVDEALGTAEYPNVTDMVPVGDMTSVNSLGETVNPIVYDRFIYANRNSRLRSQGDPIRGDLPIVPCNAEWFRPSVHPNIDLQEGAMNVMGGVDNGTTRALAELISATSGDTTIAGVNLSSMRNVSTGQALSTVNVTAFP